MFFIKKFNLNFYKSTIRLIADKKLEDHFSNIKYKYAKDMLLDRLLYATDALVVINKNNHSLELFASFERKADKNKKFKAYACIRRFILHFLMIYNKEWRNYLKEQNLYYSKVNKALGAIDNNNCEIFLVCKSTSAYELFVDHLKQIQDKDKDCTFFIISNDNEKFLLNHFNCRAQINTIDKTKENVYKLLIFGYKHDNNNITCQKDEG